MKALILFCFAMLAAIPAKSQDYFPLNKGSYWVYNYYINGSISIAGDSVYYVEKKTINDTVFYVFMESALEERLATITDSTFLYQSSSDANTLILSPRQLEGVADSTIYAKHSFTDGDWWLSSSKDTVKVTYIGSITSPVGTFDSCYQMSNGFVFAPRVGIVRKINTYEPTSWYDLIRYYIAPPSKDETPVQTSKLSAFSVYPVPASNTLYVKGLEKPTPFKIISISGALIKAGTTTDNKINLSDRDRGFYLLQIQGVQSLKFVKQ
jgi:hypothetical protein